MSKQPGQPRPFNTFCNWQTARYPIPIGTGHLSVRNTGPNTLWLSLKQSHWVWDDERKLWINDDPELRELDPDNDGMFDVASGTSFDDDLDIKHIYVRTKNGHTSFSVNPIIWT